MSRQSIHARYHGDQGRGGKLLKKINPSKACGPDMIPARILQDMAAKISPILTTLFQRTIDLGKLNTLT